MVNPEAVAAAVGAAPKSMKWGKFADNFFYVTAASNVDWFDDAAWADDEYILRDIGCCGRQRRRVVQGLFLIPSFVYWARPAPWKYDAQPRSKDKTFAEVAAMARKARRSYESDPRRFPNPVFLTCFWGTMSDFAKANRESDPASRENILKKNYYGLYPAFIAEDAQAASPGTRLIDGDRPSYYCSQSQAYLGASRMPPRDESGHRARPSAT